MLCVPEQYTTICLTFTAISSQSIVNKDMFKLVPETTYISKMVLKILITTYFNALFITPLELI